MRKNPKEAKRQSIPFVVQAKRDYNRRIGLSPPWEGVKISVNKQEARERALLFDRLPICDLDNPIVRKSYLRAAAEIHNQWVFATEQMGMLFEPWRKEGQPYPNSQAMFDDVAKNNHLYFFTGGEKHPVFGYRINSTGYTVDYEFRAIHDLFGHSAEGNQFGPQGEENAWLSHSQMFSPLAQRAITAELRGQNSWLNFGPHMWREDGTWRGDEMPIYQRPIAEQKVALLPPDQSDWENKIAQQVPVSGDVDNRRIYRLTF